MVKNIVIFLMLLVVCSPINAKVLDYPKDFKPITATVFIMGPINHETFETLRRDIEMSRYNAYCRGEYVKDLQVDIISSGGRVDSSKAIYNLLRRYHTQEKMTIHTVANAICMSGAVTILQAGDVRYTNENTVFMTHLPLYRTQKDAEITIKGKDIESWLLVHNLEAELFIELHSKRMGRDIAFVRTYFTENERYFRAVEALQAGFVDYIILDSFTIENVFSKPKARISK